MGRALGKRRDSVTTFWHSPPLTATSLLVWLSRASGASKSQAANLILLQPPFYPESWTADSKSLWTKHGKALDRLWLAQEIQSGSMSMDKACRVHGKEGPGFLRMLHQELVRGRPFSWPPYACPSIHTTCLQRENLFCCVAASFLLLGGFLFAFTLWGFVLLISFCFCVSESLNASQGQINFSMILDKQIVPCKVRHL